MEDLLPPYSHAEPQPARWSTAQWLGQGLRAALLLPPRLRNQQPGPTQMGLLLLLLTAVELGLARLEVDGPAEFSLRSWLAPWWGTAALLFLAWWALAPSAQSPRRADEPTQLGAWYALWTGAMLLPTTVSMTLGIFQARDTLPALLRTEWAGWGIYLALWAWAVAIAVQLARCFGATRWRAAILALGLVTVFGATTWLFPERPWIADASVDADEASPQLQLSQEVFEAQQAAWTSALKGLAPQRPGVIDVYGLVFAPYAEEDVFLRESTMVAGLLAERFDAQGRVLHLVNHAGTAQTHPWATPINLERAVQALAERMDTEHDVLVVYLTSHGASNYQLAASNGPLSVQPVSPGELRQALDKAGIRNRVIAVSACYSGGWVGPLASSGTLMMTAADATHTSYGCGRLSPLTFFGRAVFDEQLRKTFSFEQAFKAAVPLIAQREVEGGKKDGFSNPQMSVGDQIRPVLRALEERLQAR